MDTLVEEWSPELVEAVRIWTADGFNSLPQFEESLLVKRFGVDAANRLLPLVRKLYHDYHKSDAIAYANSIQEQFEMAKQDFLRKYPSAPETVVDALSRCYAFSNR